MAARASILALLLLLPNPLLIDRRPLAGESRLPSSDSPSSQSQAGSSAKRAGLRTIEFLPLGKSNTAAATYGSHNQKTAVTPSGIFAAFVDELGTSSARWRLMRTNDEGRTFTTVWTGRSSFGAPALESDRTNLFLAVPSESYPDGTFIRIDPEGRQPAVHATITGGGDGHYNLIYDAPRDRLLYAASVYTFLLDAGGSTLEKVQLFPFPSPGERLAEIAHYPLLARDAGLIALANTTTPYPGWTGPDGRPNNCYPSFGLLLSTDGGRSWEDPRSGRRLQLPIDAGQNGPSYHPLERAVTEIGERCMHNWLSGFLYKSGRILMGLRSYDKSGLHGASLQPIPDAIRFLSFDVVARTLDLPKKQAQLRGQELAVGSSQIFFTSGERPDDPVYVISAEVVSGGARMIVLVSHDLGDTWHDYAASEVVPDGYANSFYGLSATRRPAPDGSLYGTFTLVSPAADGPREVFFFRVRP